MPVANTRQVSEVEVSLSTVTALKLLSISGCSRPCSTGAAIGASVKMKLSIVAIAGAIMPEPLAMPEIETGDAVELDGRGRDLGDRCRWS